MKAVLVTHQKHAKDRRDETRKLKCPFSSDDVGYNAERECSQATSLSVSHGQERSSMYLRETNIGAGEYQALLSSWHTHLLTENMSETLGSHLLHE